MRSAVVHPSAPSREMGHRATEPQSRDRNESSALRLCGSVTNLSASRLRAFATTSCRKRPRTAGFTLMEVMIGLALLGVALTVLIKSAGNSIFNARQAQMMGVATDLSRAKMYDIEEILLKDGFTETDQSEGDIGELVKVRVLV